MGVFLAASSCSLHMYILAVFIEAFSFPSGIITKPWVVIFTLLAFGASVFAVCSMVDILLTGFRVPVWTVFATGSVLTDAPSIVAADLYKWHSLSYCWHVLGGGCICPGGMSGRLCWV